MKTYEFKTAFAVCCYHLGAKHARLFILLVAAYLLQTTPTGAETLTASTNRLMLGSAATPEEIAILDIDVLPDGRGLPEGLGTVAQGKQVYDDHCLACHGERGKGGPLPPLAGGLGLTPAQLTLDPALPKTISNYWAYAPTVFDYIRRAMPFDRPGTLTNDEVYAVTAYLLYLNELITEEQVIDAITLPAVAMPALKYYRSAYQQGAAP